MSAAQARALRSIAEPIVAALGCDLEDVVIRQAGKRRLVRVVVDSGAGLPLDLVAEISREISRALDEADAMGQAPYVLEVTSPGVDRPLRLPRHWARATGRLVAVTQRSGGELEGRVVASDEQSAVLLVDGVEQRVAFDEVARAVVQVEFSRVDEADLGESGDGEADDASEEG